MKPGRHHNHRYTSLASAVAIALLGSSTVAQAQQMQLEEVVVTAQKRTENLQDVPISIIAISGEKVNDFAIIDLEELTQYVPNVTINNGAGTPNLFIRGVGSGTNAGFEQSVGMFIDGVYAGRGALAGVPTTMDLERVEILKGPLRACGIMQGVKKRMLSGNASSADGKALAFDVESVVKKMETDHDFRKWQR